MEYAIVENGMVTNMIVAEPEYAAQIGALQAYDGCGIGDRYHPPDHYTGLEQAQQEVTDRELEAIALGQTVTDLELSCLAHGQVLDMMLLGGNADV